MKEVGKFCRLGVRVREFFMDNFVMFAGILLAVWFLTVWIAFRQGNVKSEQLTASAMFGTAWATLLLAIGTALMARETTASRKLNEAMIKENRKLAERARIKELVGQAITPLLLSAEKISLEWTHISHYIESASRLLLDDYYITRQLGKEFEFKCTLHEDLRNEEPSLTLKMKNYSDEVWQFWETLLDLYLPDSKGSPEMIYSIDLSQVPNAKIIRAKIKENADNFKKKISEVASMLEQTRDKYRKDYSLTEEEIEESMERIKSTPRIF